MSELVIVAAVEGGGTSFAVAIADVTNANHVIILKQIEVDSSHDKPLETLQACATFLEANQPPGGYHALGVASFGPVGVNPEKSTYGSILATTPKEPWRNVNVLAPLQKACQGSSRPLAVRVETDVNAPALAEFSQEQGISSLAYITVGTGIGVGLVINGQCVHGRMHPEGGHVPVRPLDGDPFKGYSWGSLSPFGGKQTVEGIASSVALTERLEQMEGTKYESRNVLADLSDYHEVWDHAANAIASLCATLMLVTSVEKIVLGGGVMKRNGLMDKIRNRTVTLINGYLELPSDMSTLITSSRYGQSAGLMGAIALAQTAYDEGDGAKKPKMTTKEAFYHGLWHGAIVGGALAFAGLVLMGKLRRA
jgi:fructokinase